MPAYIFNLQSSSIAMMFTSTRWKSVNEEVIGMPCLSCCRDISTDNWLTGRSRGVCLQPSLHSGSGHGDCQQYYELVQVRSRKWYSSLVIDENDSHSSPDSRYRTPTPPFAGLTADGNLHAVERDGLSPAGKLRCAPHPKVPSLHHYPRYSSVLMLFTTVFPSPTAHLHQHSH